MERTLFELNEGYSLDRPYIPHHIAMLLQCKQGCTSTYNNFNNSKKYLENNYKRKWSEDLDITIDNYTWKKVFKTMFNNLQENKFSWFQYKVIHRILGVGKLLNKMSTDCFELTVAEYATLKQKHFYTYLYSVSMQESFGIV